MRILSFNRFCLSCWLCFLMPLVLLDVKLSHDDYCEGKRQQECHIVNTNGRTPIIMSKEKRKGASLIFFFCQIRFQPPNFPISCRRRCTCPRKIYYFFLIYFVFMKTLHTNFPYISLPSDKFKRTRPNFCKQVQLLNWENCQNLFYLLRYPIRNLVNLILGLLKHCKLALAL